MYHSFGEAEIMKTLKERTIIQQAKLDGESIEIISLTNDDVWNLYLGDKFNWQTHTFRVKPKLMEIWVNIYNYDSDLLFDNAHKTKKEADLKSTCHRIRLVKFVQVPDDE